MPADFETRVLLRGEQTGDEISVIENTVSGRWAGPPLHTHEFDETFYVLGGELTFQLEETLTSAAGGEIVFAPRGVPHTLANQSDADASYLLFCTPAGFERYFARLAAERAGVEPPAWALQPIPEVTRVGPQIGRAEPKDRSKQKTCTRARDAREEPRGDPLWPVQGMHRGTGSRPRVLARCRRGRQKHEAARRSAGREPSTRGARQ